LEAEKIFGSSFEKEEDIRSYFGDRFGAYHFLLFVQPSAVMHIFFYLQIHPETQFCTSRFVAVSSEGAGSV